MKIRSADVRHVRLPLVEPIVNAPPFPGQMRDDITQLPTEDGIEGIGVTLDNPPVPENAMRKAPEDPGLGLRFRA